MNHLNACPSLKSKKMLLPFLILSACLWAPFSNAETDHAAMEKEASDFVKSVASQIVEVLQNKDKSLSTRRQNFKVILKNNFDMKAVGKFSAGRFYRSMSDDQQNTYHDLFFNAVAESYVRQFDEYNGENFTITGASSPKKGPIIVKGRVIRPGNAQPIIVQWKVYKVDNGFTVTDIIVDNVSMAISLRNEYADVAASRGIDGLLKYLSQKISKDEKEIKEQS